jgi:hypothetical protein
VDWNWGLVGTSRHPAWRRLAGIDYRRHQWRKGDGVHFFGLLKCISASQTRGRARGKQGHFGPSRAAVNRACAISILTRLGEGDLSMLLTIAAMLFGAAIAADMASLSHSAIQQPLANLDEPSTAAACFLVLASAGRRAMFGGSGERGWRARVWARFSWFLHTVSRPRREDRGE